MKSPRILIVEDEIIIASDLEARLREFGYSVRATAASAEEALDLAEQDPPDLVLMDIVLAGEMDGINAAVVFRSRWNVPVVFVTAYAEEERLKQARLALPFGYVLKPFQDRDLKVTIEMALYVAEVDAERRKMEEALKESEGMYRTLAESMNDAIVVIQDGKTVYRNPTYEKMLGYSTADTADRHFTEVVAPEARELMIEMHQSRMRGDTGMKQFEVPLINRDGRRMIMEGRSNLIEYQGRPATMAVLRDVTSRLQAEAELKEKEEKYRTILESMQEGYFEIDLAGNLLFFNQAFSEIVGYPHEELLNMNYRDYVPAETADAVYLEYNRVFRTGKPIQALEYDSRTKDGRKTILQVSISLIRDRDDRPVGFRGVALDVTERRRTEDALRESERKYRTLTDSIDEGYFEVDLKGSYTFISPWFHELAKRPKEEIIGANYRQYMTPESSETIFNAFNRIYTTGQPAKKVQVDAVLPDGSLVYHELSASLVRDSAGQPIGFRGIARDVTDRRKAQDALREKEALYELVTQYTADMIAMCDQEANFIFVSPSYQTILGYDEGELIGRPIVALVHPDDLLELARIIEERQVSLEPQPVEAQYRMRHKDGRYLWFETLGRILFDEAGREQGAVFSTREITARRLTDEALKESEARLRRLVETINDGVIHIDAQGRFQQVNEHLCRMLGYTREELIGHPGLKIVDKSYQDMQRREFRKRREGRSGSYEIVFIRKDGTRLQVHLSGIPLFDANGAFQGTFGVCSEVEAALVETGSGDENRLARKCLDVVEVILLALDREGRVTLINRKGNQVLGYEGRELIGRNWFDTCLPEDVREKAGSEFKGLLEAEVQELGFVESRIRGKDGRERLIRWRNALLRDDAGRVTGTLSSGEDITGRERAREALRASDEKFRVLVENAYEIICVLQDGAVKYINPSGSRLSGYTADEDLARPFIEFVHPDDRELILERYRKRLSGEDVPQNYETRIVHKKGHMIWVQVNGVPIEWEGNPAALYFISDVTERRQTREKLETALKEKEVLLREVHHRVKNNMQVISSLLNLQAARARSKGDLDFIQEAQSRIAAMSLVHESLYDAETMVAIDLGTYLQKLVAALSGLYQTGRRGIAFQVEISGEPRVIIDQAVPCGLVVNELITHSIQHAFPQGGPGRIRVEARVHGNSLELTVTGDGAGLSDQPASGRRSGLELDLVEALVQGRLAGRIEMVRSGGLGFKVVMPLQKIKPMINSG
ncbi:MAG: PAS domain S-box protein [Proteobacteria bacterium]|nr:PAS domain S-box protein [Pseudomonadota bacterium]